MKWMGGDGKQMDSLWWTAWAAVFGRWMEKCCWWMHGMKEIGFLGHVQLSPPLLCPHTTHKALSMYTYIRKHQKTKSMSCTGQIHSTRIKLFISKTEKVKREPTQARSGLGFIWRTESSPSYRSFKTTSFHWVLWFPVAFTPGQREGLWGEKLLFGSAGWLKGFAGQKCTKWFSYYVSNTVWRSWGNTVLEKRPEKKGCFSVISAGDWGRDTPLRVIIWTCLQVRTYQCTRFMFSPTLGLPDSTVHDERS